VLPHESAPESDLPAMALDADALGHLRALGQAVRAAPPGQHQDAVVDLAVRTATRYQADGAAWPEIAGALGVNEELLRQWRRIPDTKPAPSESLRPSFVPLLGQPGPQPAIDAPIDQAISQSQTATISQHQTQSQTGSTNLTGGVARRSGLVRLTHARQVLVVSGDARPGDNDFSLEAAAIRQRLSVGQIEVRELAAAELTEIAEHLDHHQPAVLHVCAHSDFSGVYFPLEGASSVVAYATVWETIIAARRPPRLVVLNLCQWPEATHGPDTTAVETLICWPALVDDEQARSFSRLLHGGLAMHRTITAAFHAARRTVCDRWPDLEPPALHGDHSHPIF
jgi:hypothetical protein